MLFVETSEDKPSPESIKWTLRNLAARDFLKVINGVIVRKPQDETYYEKYQSAMKASCFIRRKD